jgi:hypothetical protein
MRYGPAMARTARIALVLLGCGFLGCDQEPPEEVPAADPADHGEAPDPDEDPLGARIHAIGLDRIERYEPSEVVHRGSLRAGQVRNHPEVMLGTSCYVVIGVSEDSLEELSLSILDPGGAPILQSPARGTEVTIGLRDALCPVEPGVYKIRARSYKGDGDYAIRVYAQRAL